MEDRHFTRKSAPPSAAAGKGQKYLSPEIILTRRGAVPWLCAPDSPAIAALRAAASAISKLVVALLHFLATGDVIAWARSVLFDMDASPERRASLVQCSDNLAALPPKLLFESSMVTPVGSLPASRTEIEAHCKGLISRPGRAQGAWYRLEDALPQIWAELRFEWADHIADLDKQRTVRPELFAALMQDRAGCAWAIVREVGDEKVRSDLIRIAIRHWLLNRAFHLQRAVAYIASSRRAATPAPFRSICGIGNTSVAAARAWVLSLAEGAGAHLAEFAVPNGGVRGPRPLPVRFARAALEPWLQGVSPLDQASYEAALTPLAPTIASRIPAISRMVDMADRHAARRHRLLYAAAGLVAFKVGQRRSLFSNWNFGLSPVAALVLVTERFFDAAEICRRVQKDPDSALIGTPWDLQSSASKNKIKAAVDELSRELMGEWAPKHENLDVPFRLAAAFRSQIAKRPGSAAARHFAEIDPLGFVAERATLRTGQQTNGK